jgi:hypothetical protein
MLRLRLAVYVRPSEGNNVGRDLREYKGNGVLKIKQIEMGLERGPAAFIFTPFLGKTAF